MRYGLELPCGGDGVTVESLVRLGVEAERSGWDGVFFEDYLVYYRGDDPPTFDPWLLLGEIAGRTERIWLGTAVSGLLTRDPVKLAREAATLSALAPGRVVLGVGVGDSKDRGSRLGVWPDVAGPRGREVDRRLDLLLDLLRGKPVAANDDEPPVAFRPSPSGVRVWVGGSLHAAAVVRRCGRADGVVPFKLADTSRWEDFTSGEIDQLVSTIAERRGGMTGFDVAIGGRRRLPSMSAERAAISQARHGGATWWLEFVPPDDGDTMLATVSAGPIPIR